MAAAARYAPTSVAYSNVFTCSTSDCNSPLPAASACAVAPPPPPQGSCPLATTAEGCLAGFSAPTSFLAFLNVTQPDPASPPPAPTPVALALAERFVCATYSFSCEAAVALRTSYTAPNGTVVTATAADCPGGQVVRSYLYFRLSECSFTLQSLRRYAYFDSLYICGATNCTNPENVPSPPPAPPPLQPPRSAARAGFGRGGDGAGATWRLVGAAAAALGAAAALAAL